MSNIREGHYKLRLHINLLYYFYLFILIGIPIPNIEVLLFKRINYHGILERRGTNLDKKMLFPLKKHMTKTYLKSEGK